MSLPHIPVASHWFSLLWGVVPAKSSVGVEGDSVFLLFSKICILLPYGLHGQVSYSNKFCLSSTWDYNAELYVKYLKQWDFI